MKNHIICLVLLLASLSLGAQNVKLTPEVVASAGDSYTSNTLNVDWTLGEIMTETFDGSIVLTQGFQQPSLSTTAIGGPVSSFGIVKVYPNPTSSSLSIEREKQGELQLLLLDMRGSVIQRTSTTGLLHQLDLSELPKGIYVLRMSDREQASQSFRIVKQ
ncbi:MAG: T9SS type A sorting domain-containing protein [Bacteroidota bacterium]